MAITSGTRDHRAYVSVDGQQYLITTGSVETQGDKKSSTFGGYIPMGFTGAMDQFTELGENETKVIVVLNGVQTTLLTGEIDDIEFDYIEGLIHFSGRDKSSKLHETKSSEKFINQKPSDIVKTLAGKVGLKTDVDDSQLQAGKYLQIDWTKMTDGVTYSAVIHKLAELDGAKWWVDGNGVLHYKMNSDGAGIYTFNYSEAMFKSADMTKLSIRVNVQASKTVKATVKSWHSHKKQVFTGTKTIIGKKGVTTLDLRAPDLNQAHADKHAASKAKDATKNEINVSIQCVGDPTIDPSMKLRLSGTKYHDQDYEFQSISHRFGMQSYGMALSAKAAKKGRDGSAGSNPSGAVSGSKSGAASPISTATKS